MSSRRRVALVVRALVAWCSLSTPARADTQDAGPSPLVVAASCERAIGPGRVRCDVEARTSSPFALRWVDVQVVETPPFLSPLKGRVGPTDAAVREPELVRFALGMVARERGAGEIRLRVRAVVCEADACTPASQDVRARVVIGPE